MPKCDFTHSLQLPELEISNHYRVNKNPLVKEVYQFKESMHRFYRIKGKNFARKVLSKITDQMALSKIPEVKSLREPVPRRPLKVSDRVIFIQKIPPVIGACSRATFDIAICDIKIICLVVLRC
jgi:hypothetical protein